MSEFRTRLKAFLQGRASQGYSRLGVPVYVPNDDELKKFENTAKNIGIPPEWLANLVNHETAGTFSTKIQNQSTNATGLIQFMPSTATGYGVTVGQLKQMSFGQQLDYVSEYLKRTLKARKAIQADGIAKTTLTQPDFFMLVFYPVAVGNPFYQFPTYVSDVNSGIQNPAQYLSGVYNKSQPPFPEYSNPTMTVADYIKSKISLNKPLPMMSSGRIVAIGGVVLSLGLFIFVIAMSATKRASQNLIKYARR